MAVAQSPADPAAAPAPSDTPAPPAQQAAPQQIPPQQAPPQQAPPQQQPPAQPPAETPQVETQRTDRLPPPPPKVIDVRMPGEAGWYAGLFGWLPVGHITEDKGHGAAFTQPSKLQLVGTSKGAPGGEIGIAAGLHNSIRISYWFSKTSGTTTAANDLVIFSQPYVKGDQLTTNAKLSNYKISYEYLTWPYPVEARHFRLKTLWQVQYITMRTVFDAPIKSGTPDSSGNYTSYATLGSKGYITPSFGLGFHEYVSRNFRLEANISGFEIPHRFQLADGDATIAYRVSHIELRAGAKAFLFRTSPKSDYFYRGTMGGVFVGVRWYSD